MAPKGLKGTSHAKEVCWKLSLYVMGGNPRSRNAIENLRNLCEEHLKGHYRIKIVDLIVHPELARKNLIFAIPTLTREAPPLEKRIIGDLSDHAKVMEWLEMPHQPTRRAVG
jgi:circadian clock protein KaiB